MAEFLSGPGYNPHDPFSFAHGKFGPPRLNMAYRLLGARKAADPYMNMLTALAFANSAHSADPAVFNIYVMMARNALVGVGILFDHHHRRAGGLRGFELTSTSENGAQATAVLFASPSRGQNPALSPDSRQIRESVACGFRVVDGDGVRQLTLNLTHAPGLENMAIAEASHSGTPNGTDRQVTLDPRAFEHADDTLLGPEEAERYRLHTAEAVRQVAAGVASLIGDYEWHPVIVDNVLNYRPPTT